jgi:hypothetical protein
LELLTLQLRKNFPPPWLKKPLRTKTRQKTPSEFDH